MREAGLQQLSPGPTVRQSDPTVADSSRQSDSPTVRQSDSPTVMSDSADSYLGRLGAHALSDTCPTVRQSSDSPTVRPTVRQYALKLYLFAMACVQLAPDSLGKRLSEVVRQQRAQRMRRD